MADPVDTGRHVRVTPPLSAQEVDFLLGFTRFAVPAPGHGTRGQGGRAARVHRMWPGQPGVWSPWLPCRAGCCLVLERCGTEPAAWLRFLIRAFLRPGASAATGPGAPAGLTFDHRLDGRVPVPGADLFDVRTLAVAANRVTERQARRLDQHRDTGPDWVAPRPPARSAPRARHGTVVDLAARRRTPAGDRQAQSTER